MASTYPRSNGRGQSDRLPTRGAETPQSPRRDLSTLYEKLLALRLDLVHGVMPRAERITLTAGDLEYLLVHLDSAIAVTRDIVGAEPLDMPHARSTQHDTNALS